MALTIAIVGTTAYNIKEQEKRATRVEDAQKKAANVENAIRTNQARKSRRAQIAEARVRQAAVENESASSGQTGSSSAIAAGDSLQAQLGTNVGSINNAVASGSFQTNAQQGILDANRKSSGEILSGSALRLAGV